MCLFVADRDRRRVRLAYWYPLYLASRLYTAGLRPNLDTLRNRSWTFCFSDRPAIGLTVPLFLRLFAFDLGRKGLMSAVLCGRSLWLYRHWIWRIDSVVVCFFFCNCAACGSLLFSVSGICRARRAVHATLLFIHWLTILQAVYAFFGSYKTVCAPL